MAHMIYKNNMAYRGETPWHGLGTPITDSMTEEDILNAAGMNHRIVRRLVHMRLDRNDESQTKTLAGYMAIVRESDNHVFQVASDRYTPMQYRDMLSLFRDFVSAGDMEIETLGLLKDGAIAWAMARFTEDFSLNSDGKDKILPRVLIYTSHDGSMVTGAKCIATRVVCWNTLSIARSEEGTEFRIKHSRKDTKQAILEAKKAVGLFRDTTKQFTETADMLIHTRVQDNQQVLEYVARLTNPRLLDNIIAATAADDTVIATGKVNLDDIIAASDVALPKRITESDLNRAGKAILNEIINSPGANLPTAKDTWWGVLNGVTSYVDHEAGTRLTADDNRRDANVARADNRLTSAWFGQGDRMKSTALELAVQYANGTVN